MKYAKMTIAFVLCLCLCGCSVFSEGSYISIESHPPQSTAGVVQTVTVSNYDQLYRALVGMVKDGVTQQIIYVDGYDKQALEGDMTRVSDDLRSTNPIAAYAVEDISCTLGTSGGTDALSVEIVYLHDRSEIRKIVNVSNNTAAAGAIAEALKNCDTGIVLQIAAYEEMDFEQLIEDYAMNYPEFVMETPSVSVNLYPEEGTARVAELKFTYQTSRDILKSMQEQVSPVFASAVLYVSGDGSEHVKYSQLYSFLMERFEYELATSLTPTYSLLRQGVGDMRAFAMVYAAMCRQAGLSCMVVSGTRNGESWYWNIVLDDGVYYHVDLLRCSQENAFTERGDEDMDGYVWAVDFYPDCGISEDEKIIEK